MGWRIFPIVGLLVLGGCSWFDREQAADNSAKAEAPVSEAPAIAASAQADKQDIMPEDVSAFISKREGCDHFRGEEAYDKERGAIIRDNLEQLCTGTDAALAALKQKYAASADVTARLSAFETTIE